MNIAILGIGEAGGALARDLLQQGVTLSGWDPEPQNLPDGLLFAGSNPAAARDADLVLSTNRAAVAVEVAREVLPVLGPGQVYADLNTAAPEIKRQIDELFRDGPAQFADVAIMSPILPHGVRTPTLACGGGAGAFFRILSGYGMPVTVLDGPAGQAAVYKLLRSTFYKGVAAVVLETAEVAEALGLEAWAREQMLTVLKEEAMIDRFIRGSKKHAARRAHEMDAVIDMLTAEGVRPLTSAAARERLIELTNE
jgi:3-hydroxyisobutyrate dehydrogenase-like beta-hydroxyacid dehydrogenase